MRNRDSRIDTLRVLGTFLIILAHSLPPVVITNLRTFDVVLLVFISGISFKKSNVKGEFFKYLHKRVKKLVIPTYLLLAIIFLLTTVISSIFEVSSPFTFDIIISSFLFYNKGIGFIWIVKVYLYTAILLYSIRKVNKNWYTVSMFFIHLLYIFLNNYLNINNDFYNSYFIDIIPYGVIAILGYELENRKNIFPSLFIGVLCLFLFSQFHNGINFNPNNYKYPPSIYYLSYGLLVSLVLYRFIPSVNHKVIFWLSKNSYSLYLIHIFYIFSLNFLETKLVVIKIWYVKLFLLLLLSILTLICLLKIKSKVGIDSEIIKKD
ncbi:acyltransferase family protein [Streptococcus uberis]|uniref:acyltransferase family protein n=1 Tax=Streptococcus uberis TaxID=1349 RepID=UPI001FF49D8B|nr:acyltransferase [Streptococcus uberis]MCK1225172.1 acyltransferase [Streptococcus uberis]